MSSNLASMELLRRLPSVEKLNVALGETPGLPGVVVLSLIRSEVARLRDAAMGGIPVPEFPEVVTSIRRRVESVRLSRIVPVINGTGVLIHTNLGRAPMSLRCAEAVATVARSYNTLEYDAVTGERGKRGAFLEQCLCVLTGAGGATVTNNCAAALVLILRALTTDPARREAIISRGQLVEIGGGFRVPEIMETSGAVLREVGATNKTNLEDYRRALSPATALLLRVHRSNFSMEGFTGEPDTGELAVLAREHGVPLVEDLGSGAVMQTDRLAALEHEPTPQEILAAGADLVCFSGDKLFGGPQAGIICGRPDLIARIKKDPLFRALRCDKMVLTALQETAATYLEHAGGLESAPLPLLEMLSVSPEVLTHRARAICEALSDLPVSAVVGQGRSCTGGGTMPRSSLASVTVDISSRAISPGGLAERLRLGNPAVVACVEGNVLRLDLRTIFPEQDALLTNALRSILASL